MKTRILLFGFSFLLAVTALTVATHKQNKYSQGDCYTQDVEAWEEHTTCKVLLVGKRKYKAACPLAAGLFVQDFAEVTDTFQVIEENTVKADCGVINE